jgi:hypothetical protein
VRHLRHRAAIRPDSDADGQSNAFAAFRRGILLAPLFLSDYAGGSSVQARISSLEAVAPSPEHATERHLKAGHAAAASPGCAAIRSFFPAPRFWSISCLAGSVRAMHVAAASRRGCRRPAEVELLMETVRGVSK